MCTLFGVAFHRPLGGRSLCVPLRLVQWFPLHLNPTCFPIREQARCSMVLRFEHLDTTYLIGVHKSIAQLYIGDHESQVSGSDRRPFSTRSGPSILSDLNGGFRGFSGHPRKPSHRAKLY